MSTEKKVFKIDLSDLAPVRKNVSKVFSILDNHFLNQFNERKDMIRCYKDIPVALNKLYQEPDYIKSRHGLDIQVTIEIGNGIGGKKRKRVITLIKDSFSAEEEHVF